MTALTAPQRRLLAGIHAGAVTTNSGVVLHAVIAPGESSRVRRTAAALIRAGLAETFDAGAYAPLIRLTPAGVAELDTPR